MFEMDSEDVLDIDMSPEMRDASELLGKAGEAVATESLPLKRLEAMCSVKCFDKVRDPWSMSSTEASNVLSCIEKCEEPMEKIGYVIEEERNKMLERTTMCLEQCKENDDACANRCVSETISSFRVDEMISRVRSRIQGFRY